MLHATAIWLPFLPHAPTANTIGSFVTAAVLQAVWAVTILLPLLLLNNYSTGGPAALLWTDIIGAAVFLTGFVIESVADAQKLAFRLNPSNRGPQGKFIDSGLWSYARYPQYFGEILVWWGMYCFCAGGLAGAQHVGVVSPVFEALLLCFVSGIPPQEKQVNARWASTQAYKDYRARTNLLVPVPRFWGVKSS
jgi:steroid 5-alpha reductase family enzyme